jgi:hypothetical protein
MMYYSGSRFNEIQWRAQTLRPYGFDDKKPYLITAGSAVYRKKVFDTLLAIYVAYGSGKCCKRKSCQDFQF